MGTQFRFRSRTRIIRGRVSKFIAPIARGYSHANESTSRLLFPRYKCQLDLDRIRVWIAAVNWLEDSLWLITLRHKHLSRVINFRVLYSELVNYCFQLQQNSDLATNDRVNSSLCKCTAVKHEVKSRVGHWTQEQMLVPTSSGQ